MYTDEAMARVWIQCAEHMTWRRTRGILDRYGTAKAFWDAFDASVREEVGAAAYDELSKMRAPGVMPRLLDRLEALRIDVVCVGDANYPRLLSVIADPPHALFVRGALPDDGERRVGVVGSRRCTRYGATQAKRIARELAERGVTVVSGLARGVDTAAHLGALECGGHTVAVLGCGLNVIYPPENAELYARIPAEGGAIISEYPPSAKPDGYRFPVRNRIISGLSQALLLVEARPKSGALSTVDHALAQGRQVYVLPGNVDSAASEVPNKLLRDGAIAARNGLDIMLDEGWVTLDTPEESHTLKPPAELGRDELMIWQALERGAMTAEELTGSVALPLTALLITLTDMEMRGFVLHGGAGLYELNPAQK